MPSDDDSLSFGDIILVPFPFTNQALSKQRPAVVISAARYNAAKPDVIVMAVTSQFEGGCQGRRCAGLRLAGRRFAEAIGNQAGDCDA